MDRWTQVTVSLSRNVPAANLAAFEALLRTLILAASRQPGHLSAEIFRRAQSAGGRDYHIIYRFADLAALRAWERSPERQELAAQAEALATGEARQELTGMEAWFDLPPAAAPPRHVMALLTLAAIWPLVSVTLWAVTPYLAALPYLVRTAITSALLVLAMTYAVMPWVTRRLLPLIWRPSGQRPHLAAPPGTGE